MRFCLLFLKIRARIIAGLVIGPGWTFYNQTKHLETRMSNILIRSITGTGTYEVPESNAALAFAGIGLETLLSGIALLNWTNVEALVETTETGLRTLSCKVCDFAYDTSDCPTEAVLDALSIAIRDTLDASEEIDFVGNISYELFRG